MIETFSRHRPLSLLAGLVLAQVLLLAYQIKRNHNVRLIRYWAVEIVTPVQRAGTWTYSKVGDVWSGYIGLHNAYVENRRLQSELERLEIRNRELESQAAEEQRLNALLKFRDSYTEAPMLAARVIGASADPASHTLFVNRGTHDRVARNMGVITGDGIVGKIVEVYPTTSQVLLINDKDSGVGALLADTRTHGVVKGSGDPDPLMDYVVDDEKVHSGETLLTSGEDRIFPKGLLIGTVSGESPGTPFQIIRVKAAARLDRLEDVFILLSQQELTPSSSDTATSVVPLVPEPVATVPTAAASAPADASTAPASKSVKPSEPGRTAVAHKPSATPAAPKQ